MARKVFKCIIWIFEIKNIFSDAKSDHVPGIIIGAIVIYLLYNTTKNTRETRVPPSPPYSLKRIRYVHVDYIVGMTHKEYSTDYEETVSWSAYDNYWETFMDYSQFADKKHLKRSISFLDESKNEIPMSEYYYTTKDVFENDCGCILIRKTSK